MTIAKTSALAALCNDLDDAVRSTATDPETIAAVGSALSGHLGNPDLLTDEQREGDPNMYRARVLHAADDGAFSLIGLVWLPGQVTPIHDHLCWCVVGIHEGVEYETRYEFTSDGSGLVETGAAQAHVGEVAGLLPPGDIHRVRNEGRQTAISLHVYGADVRETASATRRTYDLPVLTSG